MVRFAVRGLIAGATAIVFLLIQSVFWSPAIPAAMGVVVIGLAIATYFRPHDGLLIVAAFAPLGRVWSPSLGSPVRGAEALVLAFLVGALLRGWTLHRFRDVPSDRLHVAVSLFGLIVATSCIAQLWQPATRPDELLTYVTRDYLTSLHVFGMIFSAMLLLEGLALLLYAAYCCRTQEGFGWRLARMLVIGASAAATFNLWFFIHELIETGAPAANVTAFFLHQRWSAHVSDVNAAGSFFAMIMFIACGLALRDRARRIAWMSAGLIIGLALWMTASRTAILSALLASAAYAARVTVARPTSRRQIAALVVAVSALLVMSARYFQSSNVAASQAMNIRRMFLETTWQMVATRPVFGVGIGQYARWSEQLSSPELLAIYPRENAHNNFAQVAGELGLVGLAAFIAMLAICLWPPDRARSRNPVAEPVLVGLAVFIMSWLGGHPLLVPEVAYPFWMALAIVPGTRVRPSWASASEAPRAAALP